MGEDLLDDRPFQDGGDDLELAAAVRAVLHVDVKHALEQAGPADSARPALDGLGLAFGGGRRLRCLLRLCLPPWGTTIARS